MSNVTRLNPDRTMDEAKRAIADFLPGYLDTKTGERVAFGGGLALVRCRTRGSRV